MTTLPTQLLSLPPTTRALTLTLFGLSTLLFLLRLSLNPRDLKAILGVSSDDTAAFPWLVLLPGSAIWYPWTLVTSAFTEGNAIEFVVSMLTLPLAGRYLERVWGQLEFLKFVLIVQAISSAITVFVMALGGFVLGQLDTFLYGQTYYGLMALQTAFLVAFTQLIPEHQVQIAGGLLKVRVKSLPMLYVTLSNIACIIGYPRPFLIQAGWLVSWFYLRFYKLNEHGERGDRSETFAFAYWFPPFAQPYIAKVSKVVFDLAVRLRVIRPWTDIESGGGATLSTASYSSLPGGARAEAERRRALALKALDQRMATKPASPAPPPPVALANPASAQASPSSAAGPSGGRRPSSPGVVPSTIAGGETVQLSTLGGGSSSSATATFAPAPGGGKDAEEKK